MPTMTQNQSWVKNRFRRLGAVVVVVSLAT
jgi:hypothetical protein